MIITQAKHCQIAETLLHWQSEIEAGHPTISERGPKNCSEYVRKKTGIWLGNAWHAYKKDRYPEISAFKELVTNADKIAQMASIFQRINRSTMKLSAIHSACNQEISQLVKSVIPDQIHFNHLPIGAIVGLYYPSSTCHSQAFFQAAIGRDETGRKVTSGPYFKVSEDQGNTWRRWQQSDLHQDVLVKPGDSFLKAEHFGFNTHIGFVGAILHETEPIVFHCVRHRVLATPLSRMGKQLSIVWAK